MLHTLRSSLQNAAYFIMLPFFLVPVLFKFYIQVCYNLNVKLLCQRLNESRPWTDDSLWEIQPTSIYIQICKFVLIADSGHSYMFWPSIVVIFREVLMKVVLYIISSSCLTFCVRDHSITPPWKWPQHKYITHQTAV